tara:strand:+ start:4704 stop:5132 length:429 start_codon:yes stop_codon:yes gene_type:complete
LAYTIIQVENPALIIYDMFDDVSIDDFKGCREYALSKGTEISRINQLLIFREGAQITAASDTLRSFIKLDPHHEFDSIRIIVAPTDLNYGISRMLAAYRDGTGDPIKPVRSIAEACEELSIAPTIVTAALQGRIGKILQTSW